jgi:hypothetical protein
MLPTVHDRVKKWYNDYTNSYRSGNEQLDDAVQLKYDHTLRVCGEMEQLCISEYLESNDTMLAGIAALLHDVARFEQFRIFKTFSDVKSVNHAELAVVIIKKNDLLAGLTTVDAATVISAIRHHNAIAVPLDLDARQQMFCRLLRDADKLDIYRIALDHYLKPDPRRKETVQVGIPDGSSVSLEVYRRILTGKVVPYEMIKTVADFKMIQLGWVFDLNFSHSFKCVKERDYIGALKKQLPPVPEVLQVIRIVETYLEERIAGILP